MIVAAAAAPSFLEQIGPTLVAVVLTGIVGAVVAAIATRRERSSSHAAWQRDNRLAVYGDFSNALTRAWQAIDYSTLARSADGHEQRWEDVEARRAEVGHLAWRVDLLGPPNLAVAAKRAEAAVAKLTEQVGQHPTVRVHQHPLKAAVDQAQAEFIDAARAALAP